MLTMQNYTSSVDNTLLSVSTENQSLDASSPPFPRVQIDHKTLTRPVPVRGTPISVNQQSESNTPEMRAAAFSPQSSYYSAFKPIQSPILNEQSESQTSKSLTGGGYKSNRIPSNLKLRHRVRSFLSNPQVVVAMTSSTAHLEICSQSYINDNDIDKRKIDLRRAHSLSDIICGNQYSGFYDKHTLVRIANNHYYYTTNWIDDTSSSCADYSDIDVAEIEVN